MELCQRYCECKEFTWLQREAGPGLERKIQVQTFWFHPPLSVTLQIYSLPLHSSQWVAYHPNPSGFPCTFKWYLCLLTTQNPRACGYQGEGSDEVSFFFNFGLYSNLHNYRKRSHADVTIKDSKMDFSNYQQITSIQAREGGFSKQNNYLREELIVLWNHKLIERKLETSPTEMSLGRNALG